MKNRLLVNCGSVRKSTANLVSILTTLKISTENALASGDCELPTPAVVHISVQLMRNRHCVHRQTQFMRNPDTGRLLRSNLPHAGFGPTRVGRTLFWIPLAYGRSASFCGQGRNCPRIGTRYDWAE